MSDIIQQLADTLPTPATLKQWWQEGQWNALVNADQQHGDQLSNQPAALLFFAVAHLQVGKINKARFLVQKAIKRGCGRDTVRLALLAGSVEKLGHAARIQSHANDAPSVQGAETSFERAHDLRARVLAELQAAQRPAHISPPAVSSPPVDAPGAQVAKLASKIQTNTSAPEPPSIITHAAQHGRIGILSGYYPGLRFNSPVNHRLYASRHGYRYIFDSTPRFDKRTYMRKLEAVLEYIELFDWLFWIDDDAYFTDSSIPLERFIDLAPHADLIVCKSPSTKDIFTRISSGQFLIRNTPLARRFIQEALATDLSEVQKWWKSHLGMFTKGDQDAMVYLLESQPDFAAPFCSILDHNNFNNRGFEYKKQLSEHFLVHFTGKQKIRDKAFFCQRMASNEYICSPEELEKISIR